MDESDKSTLQAQSSAVPPQSDALAQRLRQLPVEQLVQMVETFLARVTEKQRLEFLNLLPSVHAEEMEERLPYDTDEDLLLAIGGFCDRVRDGAFVEYGAGYDPKEREYHGFGDDAWIEEMDALFEDTELYFLAHRYQAARQAYETLFDCLMLQGDGGFYFTTSDPQAALHVDLSAARKCYLEAVCHLSTGEALGEDVLHGLKRFYHIGEKPDFKKLFPGGGEPIRLLEDTLLRRQPKESPPWFSLAFRMPEEFLRQIYTHFRSLEELDRFAQQRGDDHPWCYEDLVRGYAERGDWPQVSAWAARGLQADLSRWHGEGALLADYQARAAQQLGDATSMLSALWEAFDARATVERYVALRQAAKEQSQWDAYYPLLLQRLTHEFDEEDVTLGHLSDHRLLVEAMLVEGECERALEQASQWSGDTAWSPEEAPFVSVIGFFLGSVTRAVPKDTLADRYPEIARRLSAPPAFIQQLGAELFQEPLPDAERDRQIGQLIEAVTARIHEIAGHKAQALYENAAQDAGLVAELYRFQGRGDKGRRFLAELYAQYSRLRSFRAALRKLSSASSQA